MAVLSNKVQYTNGCAQYSGYISAHLYEILDCSFSGSFHQRCLAYSDQQDYITRHTLWNYGLPGVPLFMICRLSLAIYAGGLGLCIGEHRAGSCDVERCTLRWGYTQLLYLIYTIQACATIQYRTVLFEHAKIAYNIGISYLIIDKL